MPFPVHRLVEHAKIHSDFFPGVRHRSARPRPDSVMRVGSIISRNCAACREPDCCQINGSPFFLSEYDIQRISAETSLAPESFVVDSSIRDMPHKALRTKPDGTCVFLEGKHPADARCAVYDLRPLDCQLYPFTIELIDADYYWIQYLACEEKYLSIDLERLLEHLESVVLQRFSDKELESYAVADPPQVALLLRRRVIRRVRQIPR